MWDMRGFHFIIPESQKRELTQIWYTYRVIFAGLSFNSHVEFFVSNCDTYDRRHVSYWPSQGSSPNLLLSSPVFLDNYNLRLEPSLKQVFKISLNQPTDLFEFIETQSGSILLEQIKERNRDHPKIRVVSLIFLRWQTCAHNWISSFLTGNHHVRSCQILGIYSKHRLHLMNVRPC